MHQGQTWDHGVITDGPLAVEVWGRDGDLPFHHTATETRALGLQLIEHAVRLEIIEAAQTV